MSDIFDVSKYSDNFKEVINQFDKDVIDYIKDLQEKCPDNKVDLEFLNKKATSVLDEYFIIKNMSARFGVSLNPVRTETGTRININLTPLNIDAYKLLKDTHDDMDMFDWDEKNNTMLQYPMNMLQLTRDEFNKAVNIVAEKYTKDDYPIGFRLINKNGTIVKQLIVNGNRDNL